MTHLSVNLNVAALLRNCRDHPWPDIVGLARMALQTGAFSITAHPRPDQRHIRLSDIRDLRALLDVEFPDRELNVEGFPTPDFLALAQDVRADQITLVPDDPTQATSDHGWDFVAVRKTTMLFKPMSLIILQMRRGPQPMLGWALMQVMTSRLKEQHV